MCTLLLLLFVDCVCTLLLLFIDCVYFVVVVVFVFCPFASGPQLSDARKADGLAPWDVPAEWDVWLCPQTGDHERRSV